MIKESTDWLTDSKDEQILILMKNNRNIRVHEISRLLGVGTTTITKRIRQLQERGIIERNGSKKNGWWTVKKG
jgi:Predicted transcriptional regulator containing an HTH domain and an uncharacterized domain shared with the mammalian protein Schlafen